jgi:hypothetical protein
VAFTKVLTIYQIYLFEFTPSTSMDVCDVIINDTF